MAPRTSLLLLLATAAAATVHMSGAAAAENVGRVAGACPSQAQVWATPMATRWGKWDCPACDCGCELTESTKNPACVRPAPGAKVEVTGAVRTEVAHTNAPSQKPGAFRCKSNDDCQLNGALG